MDVHAAILHRPAAIAARVRLLVMLGAALVISGCSTIGAGSVQRDRVDYAGAIAESWKEQTLLNIVKLRYFDTPVFLDVASVISSYELQSEVSLATNIWPFVPNNLNHTLGATGTYTDRPTISYSPITGERFVKSLLTPIPPESVLAMIQAGHPADYIMRATVRAINGVYNSATSPPRARKEDPAFSQVIEAIHRIQQAGLLEVQVEQRENEKVTLIAFREGVSDDVDHDIRLVKQLLHLDPGAEEYVVTYGSLHHTGKEITLLTHSMLEILVELSTGVEVPPQDMKEGRAVAISVHDVGAPRSQGTLVRIRSGTAPPADDYVAVRYRGRWFWIDDRDLVSKRVLTFLMMFSSIAETGIAPHAPIVTIPAN